MLHEILIAGFGGQGVMSMGMLLAYAGMTEGLKTSWMPSYGPEMRGGTANCSVVIASDAIGSPLVTEPSGLVVMNLPSLEKFERKVKPGGLMVINSSLVKKKASRDDIEVLYVPANDIADELGNPRVANMVALGAFVAKLRPVKLDSVKASLKKVLPERRHDLIPLNERALDRGAGLVD